MKEDIEIVEYYLDQQDRKFVTEYRLRQLQAMENILNELKKLQQENEELRRGQQSLMQSRKKWKDKYYKLKRNFNYIQHEHDRLDKRNNELLKYNKKLEEENMKKDLEIIGKEEYVKASMQEIIEQYYTANEDCVKKTVIQDKIYELNEIIDNYIKQKEYNQVDLQLCKRNILQELLEE